MATKIQLRRDTAANWETTNPVLSQGELALDLTYNRIKVGDGVQPWKDLSYFGDATYYVDGDGSRLGHITVKGVKEFDYTPRGHIWVETVSSTTYTNSYTYDIDGSMYPDIALAWEAKNVDNYNVRLYINGQYWSTYNVNSIAVNGTTYTLTLGDTVNINPNDKVSVIAWVHGTRSIYNEYYMSWNWRAAQPTSNSNVVQVTVNDSDARTRLLANPTKCGITFDDKPTSWEQYNGIHLIDDSRSIKKIEDLGNNILQVTFDGRPINVRTDDNNFTITANAAVSTTGLNYVAVSRTLYPQLSDWIYYNPGTVTVNGQTLNVYPVPDGYASTYEYSDISYYGDNWVIYLDGNVTTCNQGDQITITWQKTGTDISFSVYHPGTTYGGNEYQWFNWKEDLPFFKSTYTNGIRGGEINWYCKVERPTLNTADEDHSYRPQWVWAYYNDILTTNKLVFDSHNGWDTQDSTWIGSDENTNPFYDFYDDGIWYREYPYGNRSTKTKVKIVYKMDLFIGDNDWWD